jgi:hypothetical protein
MCLCVSICAQGCVCVYVCTMEERECVRTMWQLAMWQHQVDHRCPRVATCFEQLALRVPHTGVQIFLGAQRGS